MISGVSDDQHSRSVPRRLFRGNQIVPNVVAGPVVGVVALPLSTAFVIASGARPEHGLYTAIVAGLIVWLLGGTRVQIAGPTGAFVAILAGITAKYGIDGLQIASFMAGLMLPAIGLAKTGGGIKFIPDPVIMGFTTGIGVIIWVGQWTYLFGLPELHAQNFHERPWQLLHVLPQLHVAITLLAVASLLSALLSNRVPGLRRVPGPMVAMVAATVLQVLFRADGVATIGSAFGGIPSSCRGLACPPSRSRASSNWSRRRLPSPCSVRSNRCGSVALFARNGFFRAEYDPPLCWTDSPCQRIKLVGERYGSGAIDSELALANHVHEFDAGKHIAGRSE